MKKEIVKITETEERTDEIIHHKYNVNIGCLPLTIVLGIIAVCLAVMLITSCSKIDEDVREQRIPLPQAELPVDEPNWQEQTELNK